MKGHNYGLCKRCGKTHEHPRGMLNKKQTEDTRKKMRLAHEGSKRTKTWCSKIGTKTKERWKNPEYKIRILSKLNSPEALEKKRERFKKLNKNPEFIKKRLMGLIKKPTKPENVVIEICKKYDLPFKYVGDGSFLIGFKNPDFVNCNGEKMVIEVFGDYWHNPERRKMAFHCTEEGCKKLYNEYGFKTLILWESEVLTGRYKKRLLEDEIAEKIRNFGGGSHSNI